MEVKIRNIDINVIKKINELSKKNKLSREEFLRTKLDEIAYEEEINFLSEKYNDLMDKLTEIIIAHTKVLGLFLEEFVIDPLEAIDYDLETLKEDFEKKSKELSNSKINLDYNLEDKTTLLIRDVPSDVSERIKEIAERKNISQNEFLNIYLKQLTYSNSLQLVDEKYNGMIEKTLGLLYFTDRVLAVFNEENIIDWEE